MYSKRLVFFFILCKCRYMFDCAKIIGYKKAFHGLFLDLNQEINYFLITKMFLSSVFDIRARER